MANPGNATVRNNAHAHPTSTIPDVSSNRGPTSILTTVSWNVATFMTQALSFIFLSKFIHYFVQCLDEIHDATGRRSRSKFEVISWGRIVFGLGMLVGWHVCIVRLSLLSASKLEDEEDGGTMGDDGEGGAKREKSISWGRILGRVLIPAFLVSSSAMWSVQLTGRLFFPLAVGKEEGLREGMS
jgi:hypothetical protein